MSNNTDNNFRIEKIYYSIAETNKLTGLGITYLRERVARDEIPFIKSGTKTLINVPELLKQLNKGE